VSNSLILLLNDLKLLGEPNGDKSTILLGELDNLDDKSNVLLYDFEPLDGVNKLDELNDNTLDGVDGVDGDDGDVKFKYKDNVSIKLLISAKVVLYFK
jgi:hypothetical protein